MDKMRRPAIAIMPILVSVFASIVILTLGCLVSAWLIGCETVEMDALGYLAMSVLFLTGMTGGIATLIKAKSRLLITGCIVGIGTFCVMLCIGALFFEDSFSGIGQTFLLVTGTTVATILVGTHRSGTAKNRSRRRRTG